MSNFQIGNRPSKAKSRIYGIYFLFHFCVSFYFIGYVSKKEPYVRHKWIYAEKVPIGTNHESVHNIGGL